MFSLLDGLHTVYRYAHIGVGFVGLLLFWIPVFANKGSRLHKSSGKLFAVVAVFVAGTGLVSSIWAISSPQSFISEFDRIPANQQPLIIEQYRFLFAILGVLSMSVLVGVQLGISIVRAKNNHLRLKRFTLIAPQAVMILVSLALGIFGSINLIQGFAGIHILEKQQTTKYLVPVVLALVFGGSAIGELRYILGASKSADAWLIKHMEIMLSIGIAFYTAFFVFGASRLLPIQLPGAWALLPWLIPSLIGMPAIEIWKRKLTIPSKNIQLGARNSEPS